MSTWLRRVLEGVAATGIGVSLLVIVFGIGGRSIRTPTPVEYLGYDGPVWIVYAIAVVVLVGGLGLVHLLQRTAPDGNGEE